MKTIILSAMVLAATLSTTTSKAANTKATSLKANIEQQIKIPEFATDKTFLEEVRVSFTILADGHVQVLAMNVSDQLFGTYVKKKLEKMVIKDNAHMGKVINYKFKFQRK